MPEKKPQIQSPRETRLGLLKEIEQARGSRVIAYVTSDRQGTPGAQLGSDAIRPLYDHLRDIGFGGTKKIDLFIHSRGGGVEVPWPLVSMIREYCKEFAVLVPFRAHSAATMIALAADEIVMGKKGELGPIDPQLRRVAEGQQEVWSSEDVLSYVTFMKDRAGLGDQSALASAMTTLAEKVGPFLLGNIYRTHSHIRLAAKKLLATHRTPLEEAKVDGIIETLCEKIYFHGHAIARREAEQIGLPVTTPNQGLDDLLWNLYLKYEELMGLEQPIHPETMIPEDREEASQDIIIASIESTSRMHVFRGTLKFHKDRELPQNLQVNLNIPVQIPTAAAAQIPQQLQDVLSQLLEQFKANVNQVIMDAIKQQAPIKGIRGSLIGAAWRDVTQEAV